VHYVSRKPTDTLEAYASLGYASYDELMLEAAISGPITDRIRGRLALKRTKDEGWQTNTVNGEDLNETDSFGYRAQVEFDLGTTSSLLLNVHGSEADQASVGFAHMGYLDPNDLTQTCSIDRIQNGKCSSNTFGFTGEEAVNGNFDPEHVASSGSGGLNTTIDTFGVSIDFTSDLTDRITFTSLTAYQELEKFLQDDGDGTSVVFFDEQYSADAEQLTQEFRLNGTSERSNWVAGIYVYDDERDLLTQAPTTADAAVFGGFFHEEDVLLETQSWAVFGQYEWDFTPQWTGVIGARYTDENRDFEQKSPVSFYTPPIQADRSLSENAWTGRLGLEWRPRAGTLVYGNVSSGFKSGGFSGSYNASDAATRPVTSEDVINYELGIKTGWMDDRIRLNASAFHYEVQDFQAQVFLTVATGSVITNAGDVEGTGAEFEVTAKLTDNFEVIAGLGLLDTEFDSNQIFNVAGDVYTLDGNELPSAPEVTTNIVARYYVGLGNAGELALQADYTWMDDHYLQIENDPYSLEEGYGLANAKVAWSSLDGSYVLEGFVRNLSDEEYFTYQNTLGSDWGYGVWGKPRTFGAKFTWHM
jgi:iron complex outermembrane receptor protein